MKFFSSKRRRATIAAVVVTGLITGGGIISATSANATDSQDDHTHCYNPKTFEVMKKGIALCPGSNVHLTEDQAIKKRIAKGLPVIDGGIAAKTIYIHQCYDDTTLNSRGWALWGLNPACGNDNFMATNNEIGVLRSQRKAKEKTAQIKAAQKNEQKIKDAAAKNI